MTETHRQFTDFVKNHTGLGAIQVEETLLNQKLLIFISNLFLCPKSD